MLLCWQLNIINTQNYSIMDYYRLTRDYNAFLDTYGLDPILVSISVLSLFLISIILLTFLKKISFEKKSGFGKYLAWPAFAFVAYVFLPFLFSTLTFLICEHIVALFLGAVLYSGVCKLIYVVSEIGADYLCYKKCNKS